MVSSKKLHIYFGEQLTIKNISKKCGVPELLIKSRLQNYWSLEKATTTPPKKAVKKYTYRNKKYTLTQLACLAQLSYKTMEYRLKRGWSVKQSVETPLRRHSSSWVEKLYSYKGKELNVFQLSQLSINNSITSHTLIYRFKNGWSVEDAVGIPLKQSNPDKLPTVSKVKAWDKEKSKVYYTPHKCEHHSKGTNILLTYKSMDKKVVDIY